MKRETPDHPIRGDRSPIRIGLPLCFFASFSFHACLMAMSSVWMSGAAIQARSENARDRSEDDELDTIAIYVRVPGPDGIAERGASDADGGAGDVLGDADGARLGDDSLAASSLAHPGDGASTTTDRASSSPATLQPQARAPEDFVVSGDVIEPASPAATTPPNTSMPSSASTPLSSATLPPAPVLAGAASPSLPPVLPTAPDPTNVAVPLILAEPIGPPEARLDSPPAKPVEPPIPSASIESRSAATPANESPSASAAAVESAALATTAAARATSSSSAAVGSPAGASATSGSPGHGGSSSGAGGNAEVGAKAGGGQGGDGAGPAAPGAVLTFGPPPEYPSISVRRGEEGRVLCTLHIDARGAVTRVDVLQSSGFPRLDQAAKDALAGWRFQPARKDGHAVACRVPHWVTFRLE